MSSTIKDHFYILLLLSMFLSGCQPKVYLMPAPVGMQPDTRFFDMSKDRKDENLLYTLYATNRHPYDKFDSSTGYTIFPSDTLELGFVVYSVGDKGMGWDDLYQQSLSPERDRDLLLSQEYVRARVEYDKNDDQERTSSAAEGFFDQINQALAASFDKDLTVYVHGANCNFYRATAQGAQYYHYTGHNSVVLTFSWPSAENLLKYKTDVLHAEKTVPAFARLIEILARHTNARNINILAYSAGAQVAAPGLASLQDLYPELTAGEIKTRLRIGEVYFAAPDTAFKPFIKRYLQFKDIVERTTINLNAKDKVLRLAAFHNGVSRLGRPDYTELDDEEEKILIAALQSPRLNVIDVGGSDALKLGGAHDSWYSHPWVSNDLILLLLFNAYPEERGLTAYQYESGAKVYFFPENYDSIIRQILDERKDEIEQKVLPELESQQ